MENENQNPTPAESVPPQRRSVSKSLLVLLALALVALAGFGGYSYGMSRVPQGASVIAQCAKGRGTQYVLPKDITPHPYVGPVYNVYQGKVIGLEFMIGKDDLEKNNLDFLNLALSGVKYDHINVGLLSKGHAGYTIPHYHVDVMMVPTSVTDQITCATPAPASTSTKS